MPSLSKVAVFSAEDVLPLTSWSLDQLARNAVAAVERVQRQDIASRRAQEEAERLEHARREQEQRVQQAYASGYEEGRLEGEIAEGMRLRNARTATEQALEAIHANEAKWQANVQENVAALAVAVARHIVGRELQTDATAVAELVRRALAEFPIDQPMRIRVHPMDLSLLSMQTTPTGEPITIAPNRDIHWMADARIEPGGCIVEGRERIIDGRIDTGLERVYRQLSATDA